MKTINLKYPHSAIKGTSKPTDTQIEVRKTQGLLCILISKAQYKLQANDLFEHYNGNLLLLKNALNKLLRSPVNKSALRINAFLLLKEIRLREISIRYT